ncbi:MAG: hypothetical protein KKA81_16055, partial [Bacteroidetes bacterium]|nr:hypothetical protein [Bacteroidota bacterium]
MIFGQGDNVTNGAGAADTSQGASLDQFMAGTSSMCYVANYSWGTQGSVNAVENQLNLLNPTYATRVIGDGVTPLSTDIEQTVANGLAKLRSDTSASEIMHNKFIIRDPNDAAKAATLMGSGNFSGGGWTAQNNSYLIIYNQQITQNYLSEFDEMWSDTFNTGTKTTRVYTMPNNVEVRIFFGGEDLPWAGTGTTANGLVSILDTATESIFFEITNLYGFANTRRPAEASCITRAGAGVQVEGVYDSIDAGAVGSGGKADFDAGGCFIRETLNPNNYKHHHKHWIIDMDWVGLGSVNASQSSAESDPGSDENFILINDFRLAREFVKEFHTNYHTTAIWAGKGSSDNTSVTETHDDTPPNPPTSLTVTPGANSFAVSWTKPGATADFSRYYIFISRSAIADNAAIGDMIDQDGDRALNEDPRGDIDGDGNSDDDGDGTVDEDSCIRPEAQTKVIDSVSVTLTTENEGEDLVGATNYYIAVVAVDKWGNESTVLTDGPYQLGSAPSTIWWEDFESYVDGTTSSPGKWSTGGVPTGYFYTTTV